MIYWFHSSSCSVDLTMDEKVNRSREQKPTRRKEGWEEDRARKGWRKSVEWSCIELLRYLNRGTDCEQVSDSLTPKCQGGKKSHPFHTRFTSIVCFIHSFFHPLETVSLSLSLSLLPTIPCLRILLLSFRPCSSCSLSVIILSFEIVMCTWVQFQIELSWLSPQSLLLPLIRSGRSCCLEQYRQVCCM